MHLAWLPRPTGEGSSAWRPECSQSRAQWRRSWPSWRVWKSTCDAPSFARAIAIPSSTTPCGPRNHLWNDSCERVRTEVLEKMLTFDVEGPKDDPDPLTLALMLDE